MAQTRTLKMHQNLLYHTITRQAGDIAKAVLEGIMNSVDADATFCEIELTQDSLTIMDDGRGFKDSQEIDEFFETFGTPHEEGDATYGTFRMGRGQIFAFGKNLWQSGEFKMQVDIKNKGLDYQFSDRQDVTDGCVISVELYDKHKLSRVDLADNVRNIAIMAKYAPIKVVLNGETISVDPKTEKWDYEDDLAYISLKDSGDLTIYNLGIKVIAFGGWRYGTGGTVVTKKQVKVNYARNNIMSDCPVWKKIRAKVSTMVNGKVDKKKRLTDDEKKRLALTCYEDAHAWDAIKDKPLLTDVTNKPRKTSDLCRLYGYNHTLTVAPRGSGIGEKIMRNKMAFVLSTETLERFDVSDAEELLKVLRMGGMYSYNTEIVDFAELRRQFSESFEIVDNNKQTFKEQVWIALANKFGVPYRECRQYMVGISEKANAWTDGSTFIAFDREFLKTLRYDNVGHMARFAYTLAHEYCHDDDDRETNVHGPEFDEAFREFVEQNRFVEQFIASSLGAVANILRLKNKKATKALLHIKDKIDANTEAEAKLTATEKRILEAHAAYAAMDR